MANKIQVRRGTKAQITAAGPFAAGEPVYALDTKELFIGNGTGANTPLVSATSADITYYVRTDGNDGNTGLANTAAGAFKTIGKAISMVPQVVNHTITVNVAVGTYAEVVKLSGFSGQGSFQISAPSGANVLSMEVNKNGVPITISGFTSTTTTTESFYLAYNAWVYLSGCTAISSALSQIGAYVYGGTAVIASCIFSNKIAGIRAGSSASVYSYNNSGTGNVIGQVAVEGATIGGNFTTTAGTSANNDTNTGGIINMGTGVVNPWGDNTTGNRSWLSAYQSTLQSISAGISTKVNIDTENFDTLSEFTSNRFTAKSAGVYLIAATIAFPTTGSVVGVVMTPYCNGSAMGTLFSGLTSSSWTTHGSGSVTIKLNAGDYIELYVYSSQSLTLAPSTLLSIIRVA